MHLPRKLIVDTIIVEGLWGYRKWRPGGKSPLVRPWLRWEDKVRVNI
jgi:hypothetical protein